MAYGKTTVKNGVRSRQGRTPGGVTYDAKRSTTHKRIEGAVSGSLKKVDDKWDKASQTYVIRTKAKGKPAKNFKHNVALWSKYGEHNESVGATKKQKAKTRVTAKTVRGNPSDISRGDIKSRGNYYKER